MQPAKNSGYVVTMRVFSKQLPQIDDFTCVYFTERNGGLEKNFTLNQHYTLDKIESNLMSTYYNVLNLGDNEVCFIGYQYPLYKKQKIEIYLDATINYAVNDGEVACIGLNLYGFPVGEIKENMDKDQIRNLFQTNKYLIDGTSVYFDYNGDTSVRNSKIITIEDNFNEYLLGIELNTNFNVSNLSSNKTVSINSVNINLLK